MNANIKTTYFIISDVASYARALSKIPNDKRAQEIEAAFSQLNGQDNLLRQFKAAAQKYEDAGQSLKSDCQFFWSSEFLKAHRQISERILAYYADEQAVLTLEAA